MLIWLKELLMQILIWILGFIDTVFDVFRGVAGLDTVTTPLGEQSIGEYFLSLDGVHWAFWIVFIAAIGICAVCTVVAVVKNIINAKGGEPKSHVRTLGQSLSTSVVALFMAMLLVVGMGCADKLLAAVDKGINHGNKCVLSHEIISISVSDGIVRDKNNIQGFNKRNDETGEVTFVSYLYEYETDSSGNPKTEEYDGKKYIVFKSKDGGILRREQAYNQVFDDNDEPALDDDGFEIWEPNFKALTPVRSEGGWNMKDDGGFYTKDDLPKNMWDATVCGGDDDEVGILGDDTWAIVPVPYDWKFDGYIAEPDDFSFIIAYVCALVLLFALIGATFGLVKRLYDIVLLFIALPGIVATIPLDEGAKFKLWRETVISKVFLAFGTVLAVNVFTIVAPQIWGISMNASTFTNSVLKLVLICGGALSISGGQLLFARLLGTSAEESREMAQSARTLMGGAMTTIGIGKAAGRGLFGTRNANGQRVGGLFKGASSAAGSIGGGAVNAVGSAVGGQSYKNSKFGKGVTATQKALKGFGSSAGWFGQDKSTGGATLGGAISGGIGKLGGKFAGSRAGQKTGLNNGIAGGIKNAVTAPGRHRRAATRQQIQSNAAQIKAMDTSITARAQQPIPTGREVMPGFENAPATPTAQSAETAAQKAAGKKE